MEGLLQFNENNDVTIRPELLSIPEFKAIWQRDKNKDKEQARKELTYIYFFADFRSNLIIYNEEERKGEAIRTIFGDDSEWEPDAKVRAAIDKYKELQETPTMRLLESSIQAAGKIQQYFDKIDFNERDEKGNHVYNINDLVKALEKIEPVTRSLNKLREQLRQEQEQTDERIRGGASKGEFEDPE